MKTRNLTVRLMMILFVIFDTSFQLAIAETMKIQLAHNLNLRKTEKRNGKTLLVRETVLRRGTVIEISKEQLSSAKKFSYWKNGEKNPISFLTGFKIVSAPGFSESDISTFNSRQTGEDGFYLSKDYVTKGKVIKSDGAKENVRLEEDADAMVAQVPSAKREVASSPTKAMKVAMNEMGRPYTMYRYKIAAGGQCIDPIRSESREVLRRNGITYSGKPTNAELSALAKGIGQIERMLGRPLPASWRTKFNFITGSGPWNQGVTAINVRRKPGDGKGTNVARLMHELGHKVGNTGAYEKFSRFPGAAKCRITGYADSKRNECFAEVFAAFVTFPDLLEYKCPAAAAFMSQKLFSTSPDRLAKCDPTTLTAGVGRPDGEFQVASEKVRMTPTAKKGVAQ